MAALGGLDGPEEPAPSLVRLLGAVFVASGFCGVSYEVLLGRYLHLVVGGTAYAISALLVAFLVGTSLGAIVGGRLADRVARPLRLYAWAEAGIGLYALAFPLVFQLLNDLYLSVAPAPGEHPGARHAVRFLTGVAAFVVPSSFMGMTMPAFARAFPVPVDRSPSWLVRLYSWNTLGAAAGALATAYVLVPLAGTRGSLALLSAVNVLIFVVTYRRAGVVPAVSAARGAAVRPAAPVALLFALAALTGFFCFSLEVVWTHLLAMLLGNSVYAFGLMLGSLLLGLGAGAALARRVPEGEGPARTGSAVALVLAGATVVLTLGVWDDAPRVFLLLANRSPTFGAMELTRFAVAAVLMTVPATLLGAAFPLVLRMAASGAPGVGSRVGATLAANTAGSVVGALAAPYLLLDQLGSLASLRWLGAGLLGVGAATLSRTGMARRRPVALGALALAAAGLLWPVEWDLAALGSASSIYLGASEAARSGDTKYWREDATGGLTTVVERRGVHTLLTNGKFQGDDGEEMFVQHRLAHVPALMSGGRERALVIGLGTGVTLAALAAHGYREVVCAEISAPIIEAAQRFFAHVNGGVTAWPAVKVLPEDGRSVLLEDPRRYDVVSIEVTTIWFAGVGNIYSEEFYRLVSHRLRYGGVMLQWFPVHHLSPRNLFVVVNTARSVFPYVSVWTYRHQGFVVASNQPLAIDLSSVRGDLARVGLRPYLRGLDSGSPLELVSDLVVSDADMDAFLDTLAGLLQSDRRVVSTDTWPTLEYETPKDVLSHLSVFQNRGIFRRFRSTSPLPFRGAPSAEEAALVRAAFARGWQDPLGAGTLAGALAGTPSMDRLAGGWLLSELGDRGGNREPGESDDLSSAAEAQDALGRLVSHAGVARCVPEEPGMAGLTSAPLLVTAHDGESLGYTLPEAATDGNASPLTGKGWRAKATGPHVALEVRLRRPAPIEAVDYSLRSIDGSSMTVRVFAGEGGRWYPVGQVVEDGRCRGFRRLRLRKPAAPDALRIEITPETLESALALHELWVEPAR